MDFIRIQEIIPAAKSKDLSAGNKEIRFSSNLHSLSLNRKHREDATKPPHHDLWFFKKIDNESVEYDVFLEISGASKSYALRHLENQAMLFDLDFSTYTEKTDPESFSWKELLDIAQQMIPNTGIFLLLKASKPNSEILLESIKARCPTVPRKEISKLFDRINHSLWWYFPDFKKNIDDILELDRKRLMVSAKIGLASMEVFAQEYRRLLCPTHLFEGVNLFTKYRVGFDQNHADPSITDVYVASKYISFIGYFKSYYQGVFRFKDEPYQLKTCRLDLRNQYILADQAKGLGTCTIFAKILGDIDLKFSNLGFLFHEQNETDFKFYFTQVDSGCSFAGTANIDYPPEWFLGDLTEYEIIKNPATNLNFYNYLWVKLDQKSVVRDNHQLEILSDSEQMKKENFITSLRITLLPDCLLNELARVHFSHIDHMSLKIKAEVLVFMNRQQSLLEEIITRSSVFIDYFFNLESCQNGFYRKELLDLYLSFVSFETYSSELIIKNNDLFKIEFFNKSKSFLEKVWLRMNLEQKKEFIKESIAYSIENQDSFSGMFVNMLESIDPELVREIRARHFDCCSFSEGVSMLLSIGNSLFFSDLGNQEMTSSSEDDLVVSDDEETASKIKESKFK